MSAPPVPDKLLLQADSPQTPLPLASEGVMRWIWEGQYGPMLIEVIGEDVFVNSQRVEPHGRPVVPPPPSLAAAAGSASAPMAIGSAGRTSAQASDRTG